MNKQQVEEFIEVGKAVRSGLSEQDIEKLIQSKSIRTFNRRNKVKPYLILAGQTLLFILAMFACIYASIIFEPR